MATIKSYTDLEQSKKLAEILPLESADMFHFIHEVDTVGFGYKKDAAEFYSKTEFEYIPCWSLTALLNVLPLVDFTTPQLIGTSKTLYRCMYNDDLKSHAYDNPIDACVAMIEKLHELNLL